MDPFRYVVRVTNNGKTYLSLLVFREYDAAKTTESLELHWDASQRDALRMSRDMAQMVASFYSLHDAKVVRLTRRAK